MNSRETRQAFVDYFAARGHRVVPSSPLVLPNDPTLLFANAGMNQFKDRFTGRQQGDFTRAVSTQKCLRVSGKHNDLEMVGRTPRHHTFFEMLGNFSFGDYFKREALEYAWELITGVYGLPVDRLWFTVFGGTDELAADEEAYLLWRDHVGVPEKRILRLGEKDNFWRMGESGPCGPCSEIFYDLVPSTSDSTPATDESRYVEVWNLVFMQFDQRDNGALEPLPGPSIDTGMGLERIASVLQGKQSNYDTDLFRPILDAVARRAGTTYGADEARDFSIRVIADHARAFSFLVADGVVPANDRRGYVLRRLLRRAIRHGRKLGIDEPFLHEITPVVLEGLGDVYPEIVVARDALIEIGRREEQRFAETLTTGLALLEKSIAEIGGVEEQTPTLSGKTLFRLHDTFGFPLDLARDIAEERKVLLDEEGFEAEMARQRDRARASWRGGGKQQVSPAYDELAAAHRTRFEGYGRTSLDDLRVLALLQDGKPVDRLEEGATGEAVFAATPFYAESGGQVADHGAIIGPAGRLAVLDVQRPAAELIVHTVRVESGALATGEAVRGEVDESRRDATRRNHTATHLLHAALREVVGTHVKQAGSLVAPDRLRFDFTHFSALSDEALADIENLINGKALDDVAVKTEVLPLDEALSSGAMALFGEKYAQQVRVVRIGDFSVELCGGTHCSRSGEIGLIKLTAERGIASGTRRVEAISGGHSLDRFRQAQRIMRALEERLSVGREELLPEIERRMGQLRKLERELGQQRLGQVRQRLAERVDAAETVGGVRVLAERVDGLTAQELRELADALRGKLGSGVVVLGRREADKASILVAVTDDLKGRVPAGDLVRELGKIIGGGGGGRPDMAEAGGREPERLDQALRAATASVGRRLESDA